MNALRFTLIVVTLPLVAGCKPSVNLETTGSVGLRVEVVFNRFHDAVEARWSGTLVSSAVPADRFPTAVRSVPEQSVLWSDLSPGTVQRFAEVDGVFPGIWRVSVRVFEDGSELFSIECRAVDVGNSSFTLGPPYVVRFIEGNADDECTGDFDLPPPEPLPRDVELLSLAVPAPAQAVGTVIPITANVRNNADQQELAQVTTTARRADGSLAWTQIEAVIVDRGDSATVPFNWDTRCEPAGAVTITATAQVAADSVAANNVATRMLDLTAARRLDIAFEGNNPTTITRGQLAVIRAALTAGPGNRAGEANVNLTVAESGTTAGNFNWSSGPIFAAVACGETVDVRLIYQPGAVPAGTAENHTFRLDIVAPSAPGTPSATLPVVVNAP
jgi:hypothetical protein